MNNITQIHRCSGINFSIEHVFDIINDKLFTKIKINKVFLPYAYVRPIYLIKNILHARHLCNGIVHIVGEVHYISLFISNKTIVTIHDLSFIDFNKGFKRIFFYFLWYYLPLHKVKYVTCISETVKEQIIHKFPFVRDKICTIYNPLDSSFTYKEKKFNEDLPIILHIGTAPNKNLERVIQALKGVHCVLYIVGRKKENYEQLLKASNINYRYCSNLTKEEIIRAYEESDIISFPSLYEGFGMPIIEGQAIGRVVLTSNMNPMKEIAGNAALLVDPYSVEDIRRGFLSLICNKELRKILISQGKKNILRFNANKIANQYLNIYNKIESEK